MRRLKWSVLVLALIMFLPCVLQARDIAPVVSTDWVEKNLANPKIKMIDIRKLEEYKEGHIPGSLCSFYGTWAANKGGNRNELPALDDLTDVFRSLGLTKESQVVVVGKSDTPSDLVGITRVAWTLAYAGIGNVAILDGGYNKWAGEKKAVSKDITRAKGSDFQPVWNKDVLAGKDYMAKVMKQAVLLDTRLPDAYFGVSKLPFVARAGHVTGAVCLPSVWMYAKDGTLKPAGDLEAMAAGVAGKDRGAEVIVYCDTGKFATGWWFVLSQVLGYKNVKNYDGAMEEWAKDPQAPMTMYTWH